ncbi:hypothetical protein H0H93_013352 [Arthromyces matolae]|nr:hypothetical protein H0H93_013352 [Arthromyces matolae]
MKFNDHPLSESAVEHRDPIFVARAAIDSSTDNSMPTSKHASIRDPRSELQEHIKSLEVMLFSTKLPYVQHEMEITYNFLSSLGAQYVTQKRNVWVQLVIPKARNIREVSANGGSTYPQAIKDAAKTLLDFYDNVDTMESTTLTSDEVASKVDTFRETLLSNSLAAQAALVSLDGSIAEMFTAKAQLWKLSTSDMRPGDLNYSQLRNTAARIELGAQRHAEDKIFPKSSVAAKAYLQLVAETDKKLLWKVDPKKRKAETDIDTAPYKYYLIASRFP